MQPSILASKVQNEILSCTNCRPWRQLLDAPIRARVLALFAAIPYFGSEQSSGYQYIKHHVPFLNHQQQQLARIDNLVGDLVSRLITKIENDGTQQTQQYSKE
jgi:hypothetical protein